jgi:hypothetical protein
MNPLGNLDNGIKQRYSLKFIQDMLWNENPMILIWYSHLSWLTTIFVAMTKSLRVWGCVNKLSYSVYSSMRTRRNAMPLHAKNVSRQYYMLHYITYMHKKYEQYESILTSCPSNKFSVCRMAWNPLIQLGQQALQQQWRKLGYHEAVENSGWDHCWKAIQECSTYAC